MSLNILIFVNIFLGLITGQRGIERNIIVIKHEIKNFHDRLDSVVKMQEVILDKINNLQPLMTAPFFDDNDENTIIYINDHDSLQVMEDKLTNDKNFRKKVVIFTLFKI